jgi:cytochrome c-type biogenesis protein CcmE
MTPPRKRKIRLIAALSSAVILATALIYTSFTAASPTRTPSQLLAGARTGQSYELTGTVVNNSITRSGDTTNFRVADRAGTGVSVPVTYSGSVPSPFREGREIIIDVEKQGSGFVGQSGTLVTKCPSKFAAAKTGSTPY